MKGRKDESRTSTDSREVLDDGRRNGSKKSANTRCAGYRNSAQRMMRCAIQSIRMLDWRGNAMQSNGWLDLPVDVRVRALGWRSGRCWVVLQACTSSLLPAGAQRHKSESAAPDSVVEPFGCPAGSRRFDPLPTITCSQDAMEENRSVRCT